MYQRLAMAKYSQHTTWMMTWVFQRLLAVAVLFVASTTLAGITFISGDVVGIADGDTLTILDSDHKQHRIRLAEIDAPEKGQPWGSRSRAALGDKVFRQIVDIEVIDIDRYGRLVGKVQLEDGRDINREMVREGNAWVYRQYLRDRSLLEDEEVARDARRGLWSLADPIAPWDWRHSR